MNQWPKDDLEIGGKGKDIIIVFFMVLSLIK